MTETSCDKRGHIMSPVSPRCVVCGVFSSQMMLVTREVHESLTARLAAAETLNQPRMSLHAEIARLQQLLTEHAETIKHYREKYEQEREDRQKAEARQYSVGAEHLREYAARVKERDEAREAARILFDDLSLFTQTDWLVERWPWLADEAAKGGRDE